MDTKNIIIHLIKEDMRYNQYLNIFRKLGIDDVLDFNLDLMSIVFNLIEIKEEKITDKSLNLYEKELCISDNMPIEPLGKNLDSLAENCYNKLLNLKNYDSAFTKVWADKDEYGK